MAKKAANKKAPGKSPAGAARRGESVFLDDVRELVRLMVDYDLTEVDVQDQGRRIALKRGLAGTALLAPVPAAQPAPAPLPAAAEATPAEEPSEELIDIKSPIVGTFYASPSPDSEPYVAVGSDVANDTLVCIVEAMKVMNEIRAECTGTVVDICVKNVQPVEFGQVLFRVKPA